MDPFPEEVLACFEGMREDNTVYVTMNGPSEFTVRGSLRGWSIEGRLGGMSVAEGVLVVNGRYDEATDEVVEPFFAGIKARCKWVRFGLSSHTPFLEETEGFVKALGEFLKGE